MPGWMKDWGQFIMLLAALGGFYGFIRADLHRMEDQLVTRIDGLEDKVDRNAIAIADNAIAIAELTGLVRGLHKLDLAEQDR